MRGGEKRSVRKKIIGEASNFADYSFAYCPKDGGVVLPEANALGPGSDIEKYIFAA